MREERQTNRTAAWVVMQIGSPERKMFGVVPRRNWVHYCNRGGYQFISSHRTKEAAHAARDRKVAE